MKSKGNNMLNKKPFLYRDVRSLHRKKRNRFRYRKKTNFIMNKLFRLFVFRYILEINYFRLLSFCRVVVLNLGFIDPHGVHGRISGGGGLCTNKSHTRTHARPPPQSQHHPVSIYYFIFHVGSTAVLQTEKGVHSHRKG